MREERKRQELIKQNLLAKGFLNNADETLKQKEQGQGQAQSVIVNKKDYKPEPAKNTKSRPPTIGSQRPIANITLDQRNNAVSWKDIKNLDFFASSPAVVKEREYYEQKFSVSKYEQLPFCIVIPSHNNVKDNRHINNIRSVLMQDYKNYHIVFIDDASTDGTGDEIEKYLINQVKVPPEQYVVIKNKVQTRAMPNLRMAATDYCKPEDIFIIIDGDD